MLEREREGIAKSKAEVQVAPCNRPTSPTRDGMNQNPAVRKLLDAPVRKGSKTNNAGALSTGPFDQLDRRKRRATARDGVIDNDDSASLLDRFALNRQSS
jgi:hypothetical protein